MTGPVQILRVHPGAALRVVAGANWGDALGGADDLVLGDAYALAEPEPVLLALARGPSGLTLAEGPDAGAPVALEALLTLMAPSGVMVEAVLLAGPRGAMLHPLSPLPARVDHALIGVDRGAAEGRVAALACAAFARGTRITLASGEQRPIEDLAPGMRVLTRDAGARPVRWVGLSTQRAEGAMAPVVIEAGALGNARALVLSPAHRLFVWQRRDVLGLGRAEVAVRAGQLVNGASVRRAEGGFVDYAQILFDDHHVIYAEGIAAESLMLDPRTRPALPAEAVAAFTGDMRDGLGGADLGEGGVDMAERLRRASRG